jgi:hypothetical protein
MTKNICSLIANWVLDQNKTSSYNWLVIWLKLKWLRIFVILNFILVLKVSVTRNNEIPCIKWFGKLLYTCSEGISQQIWHELHFMPNMSNFRIKTPHKKLLIFFFVLEPNIDHRYNVEKMRNKIESTIILVQNSLKCFYLQCRVALIVNLSSFETKILVFGKFKIKLKHFYL